MEPEDRSVVSKTFLRPQNQAMLIYIKYKVGNKMSQTESETIQEEIKEINEKYQQDIKQAENKLMCIRIREALKDKAILKYIKAKYKIVGDIGYRLREEYEPPYWEDTDTDKVLFSDLPYDIDEFFDNGDIYTSETKSQMIFSLLKEIGGFELNKKQQDELLGELTAQKMVSNYDVKIF